MNLRGAFRLAKRRILFSTFADRYGFPDPHGQWKTAFLITVQNGGDQRGLIRTRLKSLVEFARPVVEILEAGLKFESILGGL